MNKVIAITLIPLLIFLTNCSKTESTTGEIIRIEPNPDKRARDFVDKEGGIFGDINNRKSGSTTVDFASSNVMWRATLKTLDFLPLSNTDYSGGIIIYGSASSGKDSPGTKTKGKILGSFDFAAFSEIMGLVTTAIASKSENSLGPDFSGTKAADLANKTKEVVEYDKSQKEASQSTSGKTFICPTCNSTFSASDTAKHNKDLNRKSGPFTPTKNKQ
jgi:hypothetical protein